MTNDVDEVELAKFERSAHSWWDPNGDFRPLHDINPFRADYINSRVDLAGKRVLDIGCGGGILSEEMAHNGAKVTGIDASASVIAVAKLHQQESGASVTYEQITAQALLAKTIRKYDVITCLELLEHVPDPENLVLACAALLKEGGHVFFSTINRTPKAWFLAVLGAEYVLKLLPKGTHDYNKFIRPAELAAWSRLARLELKEIKGIRYNPFARTTKIDPSPDVNYIAWATL